MNQIPPFDRKLKDVFTCVVPKEIKTWKVQKWSESQILLLKILVEYRRDLSYFQISTYFYGRTFNSVYNKIKKLRLHTKFPRIPPP